jgi:imidazolonepropionase-like amidohydrolase
MPSKRHAPAHGRHEAVPGTSPGIDPLAQRDAPRSALAAAIAWGLLLALAAIGSPERARAQSAPTAIQNVTLIDGVSDDAREGMTVVFQEGVITEVTSSAAVRLAPETVVHDGTGQVLIPGLWDTHAHLTYWGDDALGLLLDAGVTSVREMGGDMQLVSAWRDAIESGETEGPSMAWAGPYFEGPDAPDEYRLKVSNEADVISGVRAVTAAGVDFIKIQGQIEPALVRSLVEQAEAVGTFVVGHVPAGLSALEASNLGLRSVEHLAPFARLSGGELARTFDVFKANDTWMSPLIYGQIAGIEQQGGTPQSSPEVQRAYTVVRMAHEAGVGLLIGANFAYRDWPQRPGSGLHGEMIAFADAGVPAMEVLKLATSKAAAFNRRADVNGAVREGLSADLVLLRANPLDDMRGIRSVEVVIQGGRFVRGGGRVPGG